MPDRGKCKHALPKMDMIGTVQRDEIFNTADGG